MPRSPILLLLALLVTACSGAGADEVATAPGVRVESPTEAAVLLEDPDVVVLDIRTPEEVAQGTLPGAVAIDYYAPDFRQRLEALDRDARYLLYCRSGNRSADARQMLGELGFSDVTDVEGGIVAWAEAGLPIER